MVCDKCGSGYMVDDSYYDVRVYKCWVCGNRIYVDYPKRKGSLVCSRCGATMESENALGYCNDCLKLVNLDPKEMEERTVSEPQSPPDTIFIRRSPRRAPHARETRKRLPSLHM